MASWLSEGTNIIVNFAINLMPVQKLVTGFSYLAGIVFIMKAVTGLKHHCESRSSMATNSSMKEPLTFLVAGSMLLYFPSALAVWLATFFGSPNILAYAAGDTSTSIINGLFGADTLVGRALAIIIQIVGAIAFVRGWILIARGASHGGGQQNSTTKGLIHIVGGVLAMNIVYTLQIINNTLYGS